MKKLFLIFALMLLFGGVTFGQGKEDYCGSKDFKIFEYLFSDACKKHDEAYSTLGKSKVEADEQFHKDVYRICNEQSGAVNKLKCKAVAELFYQGVSSEIDFAPLPEMTARYFSQKAYDEAQNEAKQKEESARQAREARSERAELKADRIMLK